MAIDLDPVQALRRAEAAVMAREAEASRPDVTPHGVISVEVPAPAGGLPLEGRFVYTLPLSANELVRFQALAAGLGGTQMAQAVAYLTVAVKDGPEWAKKDGKLDWLSLGELVVTGIFGEVAAHAERFRERNKPRVTAAAAAY
jgi:hypothetical protein